MKNTGRYLEAIVSSIEKSLVTNTETVIERNKKVLDRDGVEREIDVYVETKVNKKVLKYAIECKEYSGSSRVEMTHVSDFYDKIANQGIKGIIITTADFRKNAIKKAINLNINLFRIEKDEESLIKKLTIFKQEHFVKRSQILSSHFKKLNNPEFKYIYMGDSKKRYSFKDFMGSYLKSQVEQMINHNREQLFNEFYKFEGNTLHYKLNLKRPRTFFGLLEKVFFKFKNDFYEIEKWQVNVLVWLEKFEVDNPNSFKYYDIINESIVANFFAKELVLAARIKGYLNLTKIAEEGETRLDFVTDNPKDQKGIRFHDFGRFKEGEIIFGNEE